MATRHDFKKTANLSRPLKIHSSDPSLALPNGKKTKGRVKIAMRYIDNKMRRYTTFSKRKTGIMKKAYELATLTGTQVLLMVASDTGEEHNLAHISEAVESVATLNPQDKNFHFEPFSTISSSEHNANTMFQDEPGSSHAVHQSPFGNGLYGAGDMPTMVPHANAHSQRVKFDPSDNDGSIASEDLAEREVDDDEYPSRTTYTSSADTSETNHTLHNNAMMSTTSQNTTAASIFPSAHNNNNMAHAFAEMMATAAAQASQDGGQSNLMNNQALVQAALMNETLQTNLLRMLMSNGIASNVNQLASGTHNHSNNNGESANPLSQNAVAGLNPLLTGFLSQMLSMKSE